MSSQATNANSPKVSVEGIKERPTNGQWAKLHQMAYDPESNPKGLVTKQAIQRLIQLLYLESASSEPVKVETPKMPEIMERVLQKAGYHCPDAVPDLMELLMPYAIITPAMLEPKPAKAVQNYWEGFVEKSPKAVLKDALSFTDLQDIQKLVIGKDWVKGKDGDVRDDKDSLYNLTHSMFLDELAHREKLRSGTLTLANSIAMSWYEYLLTAFAQTAPYRYCLVSNQDATRLCYSIVRGIQVAVALTIYQPDLKLTKRALKFVSWQLNGNPVMRYQEGVAYVWAAPNVF